MNSSDSEHGKEQVRDFFWEQVADKYSSNDVPLYLCSPCKRAQPEFTGWTPHTTPETER